MDLSCPGCSDYPCRCDAIISDVMARRGAPQFTRMYSQADLDRAVEAARREERKECADTVAKMRDERSAKIQSTPLGEVYRDGPCAGASVWNVESRSVIALSAAEAAIRSRGREGDK